MKRSHCTSLRCPSITCRAVPRCGFTLIELLVVISIIAILISLLMPALGVARQRAQSMSCLSSVRQQGVAFHVYAADHRGRFPAAVVYNNGLVLCQPSLEG